jgi:hypothetical protein
MLRNSIRRRPTTDSRPQPQPFQPPRHVRRQRDVRRMVRPRVAAIRDTGGRILGYEADRWEWKPTQVPPGRRRARNRRRTQLAKASRRANR